MASIADQHDVVRAHPGIAGQEAEVSERNARPQSRTPPSATGQPQLVLRITPQTDVALDHLSTVGTEALDNHLVARLLDVIRPEVADAQVTGSA